MDAEFLGRVRKEIERSYRPHESRTVIETVSWSLLEQGGIHAALAALQGCYALVGQMPPEPPTWRGRLGTKAVKLVRRMLFWYTPQIVRFQYSALRAFEEQARALEMAEQRLRELQSRQDEARDSAESAIRQLLTELLDAQSQNVAMRDELQALRASIAKIQAWDRRQVEGEHSARSGP